MRLLVIVPGYPNSKNVSTYRFVHDRVKEYIKCFEVKVFVLSKNIIDSYEYENVKVVGGTIKTLKNRIKNNKYDKFAFHFLNNKTAFFILRYLKNQKVFIWFHGSDCVSYKRRLGRINYSPKRLINPIFFLKVCAFIFFNKIKLHNIRKLNKECSKLTFIFVSKWNKNACELDIKAKLNNTKVISNYINIDAFEYKKKNPNSRFNVLSINNYSNNIYAGDILQDVILAFSKEPEFQKFHFTLYGDGVLFETYTGKLRNFNNVDINKGFISHEQINKLQKTNGVFLYPKRGDSQGVSRCEAMASGLVCIASDVEAIGEFTPKSTAFLVNDVPSFIDAFKEICYNENTYLEKSCNAHEVIKKKCSYEMTIKKEIELLR